MSGIRFSSLANSVVLAAWILYANRRSVTER
jgi:hypothetical protein